MRTLWAAVAAVAAIALAAAPRAQRPSQASGFDPATFDRTVRPQDDLYQFVNGRWLEQAAVPDDRGSHSVSTELMEMTRLDLRAIVDEMRARGERRPGSAEQQVVDLYASMVDEAAIEARGLTPLEPMLRSIDAIDSPRLLAQVAGEMSATSTSGPFFASFGTHPRDAATSAIYLSQGGLLLDRDHYVSTEAASIAIRREYEKYLARIFTVSGRANPGGDAAAVLALEIELARAHAADAAADSSLPLSLGQMRREFAGFDWQSWARPQGIDRVGVIVVMQPEFFRTFAALVPQRPWATWRAWLAARYLTALSPFVSNTLGDARFEFFGRILAGQVQPIPRWKRAISLINATLGDTLGREYVTRHFPRSSRDRVRRIVEHIVRAYGDAIDQASWLSPAARGRARQKIAALTTYVGYPEVWRNYRGLEIRAGDLAGNIARAQQFDNVRRMAATSRTGGDWPAPPQTVNAYYVPFRNEVIIPAAMLQPPYFDAAADDAMNYGAIGAVIGHEIGHALTQEGWSAADRQAYLAPAQILLDQLNDYRFRDAPDLRLNGMMVLAETLGDLSGLSVAWRAWQRSLGGTASPVIDGLTGDQRFFLAWARIWRSRERPEYARQIVLTSRHAPAPHRANAIPGHLEAFYRAFGLRESDGLFIAPARRARLF